MTCALSGWKRKMLVLGVHPFGILRESENATAEDYAKILAENVVFHTPVLVNPRRQAPG